MKAVLLPTPWYSIQASTFRPLASSLLHSATSPLKYILFQLFQIQCEVGGRIDEENNSSQSKTIIKMIPSAEYGAMVQSITVIIKKKSEKLINDTPQSKQLLTP